LESNEVEPVAASVRSEIFILHLRLATDGERNFINCHPFQSGRWLFAHNGRVDREAVLKRLDYRYIASIKGLTDSEVYFYWLLQNIEHEDAVQKGLEAALRQVRKFSFTGLNFILTDGTSVYAYRGASKNEHYYSLFYLYRDPQTAGPLEYRSKEVDAFLRSKCLQQERAILICSEKLTNEAWTEIPLGSLLWVSADLIPQLIKVR